MTLLDFFNIVKQHLKLVVLIPILCALLCAGVTAFVLPAKYTATATINATAEAGSVGSIAEQAANEVAAQNGVTAKEKTDTTAKSISITATGKNAAAVLNTLEGSVELTQEKVLSIYEEGKVTLTSSVPETATDDSPSPVKYGAVALVAALFVVICLIVLVDAVKNPVRSKEEVEQIYGIKHLGNCIAVQGLSSTPLQDNSLRAKHGGDAGSFSEQSASLSLSCETLLANLQFASDSAQSYSLVPVSSECSAHPVANELFQAAKQDNISVEFKEVDKTERSQEAFVSNANKFGRIAFLTCKSVQEGIGASYAANAAEATVLVLQVMKTTNKELQETIHQLGIAKANIIGFVAVSEVHK